MDELMGVRHVYIIGTDNCDVDEWVGGYSSSTYVFKLYVDRAVHFRF